MVCFDGRHYNRAVRVHKYIYEALMRLAWGEFMIWVQDDPENKGMVDTFVEKVNSVTFNLNQQNFEELLKSTNLA